MYTLDVFRSRGFSLIEVIIAISMIAVLFGVFYFSLSQARHVALKLKNAQRLTFILDYEARAALEYYLTESTYPIYSKEDYEKIRAKHGLPKNAEQFKLKLDPPKEPMDGLAFEMKVSWLQQGYPVEKTQFFYFDDLQGANYGRGFE